MNHFRLLKPWLILAVISFICGFTSTSSAQSLTNSTNFTLNIAVPDNDPNGIVVNQNVDSDIFSLTDIQVSLNLSGGYTSDLYVYLLHDTGFSVLLNRVGITSSDAVGYLDSGFNVTFDDDAPNGDIHLYRSVLNPNGAILTQTWQPDGRNVDPDDVTDLSPRTSNLSSFNGLNPNGNWSLFLIDNSAVGQFVLQSWGMQLIGAAVPEPGTITILGIGATGLLFMFRRKSNR